MLLYSYRLFHSLIFLTKNHFLSPVFFVFSFSVLLPFILPAEGKKRGRDSGVPLSLSSPLSFLSHPFPSIFFPWVLNDLFLFLFSSPLFPSCIYIFHFPIIKPGAPNKQKKNRESLSLSLSLISSLLFSFRFLILL